MAACSSEQPPDGPTPRAVLASTATRQQAKTRAHAPEARGLRLPEEHRGLASGHLEFGPVFWRRAAARGSPRQAGHRLWPSPLRNR